jgi:hypothetical protein
MSALAPDTDQALAFLDAMFDSSATRHLVAISEDGKVGARSFKPAQRGAVCEWIEERQGEQNLYFSVNELKPGVANRKATVTPKHPPISREKWSRVALIASVVSCSSAMRFAFVLAAASPKPPQPPKRRGCLGVTCDERRRQSRLPCPRRHRRPERP